MGILFLLVILVMAVIGGVSSYYVYRHRVHGKAVECVISSDCDWITASTFSYFRGWPNDLIGLGGFSSIALLTLFNILIGGGIFYNILILAGSSVGAAYASYLIYIQFRVLRHNCTWCVVPTLSAIIIFIASVGIFLG